MANMTATARSISSSEYGFTLPLNYADTIDLRNSRQSTATPSGAKRALKHVARKLKSGLQRLRDADRRQRERAAAGRAMQSSGFNSDFDVEETARARVEVFVARSESERYGLELRRQMAEEDGDEECDLPIMWSL